MSPITRVSIFVQYVSFSFGVPFAASKCTRGDGKRFFVGFFVRGVWKCT